jgi:hypothetical protein
MIRPMMIASTAMMNAPRPYAALLPSKGWQVLGGLNSAWLSFTAAGSLRVRGANGMRPPENALLRPAEITALIMVASPRKSFSECTFPT